MEPRVVVHSLLRVGLVGMLLLSSGGHLLAQDVDGQPADSAETAAVPMGAEFSEESAAAMGEVDPNAADISDMAEENREGDTAAGPAAAQNPNDLEGVDSAEFGADSEAGGPEVGENGEIVALPAGDHRLFIPSILTAGPEVSAEMQAEMQAVMDPAALGGGMQAASSQSVMGDFNGDGNSDLAVGVPYEDALVSGVDRVDAGSINVIYGSTGGGLNATNDQVFTQNSPNMADVIEAGDLFGWALAAGDFNGDGRDDLAISVPYEDLGGQADVGAIHILYGTAAGLSATGSQFWTQDSAGVLDTSEASDLFGLALTTGDFNNDGRDDLAIGVPYENLGTTTNCGMVQILYGAAGGLDAAGNQVWSQGTPGILETPEVDDLFGLTLAAGDFNADSRADLAVGVAYEDVSTLVNAGAVQIIRGAAAGLEATGNQLFTENAPGIVGTSEANDYYGWSLANGDFNGNGADDLAIGVPYEDFSTLSNPGTINVIYGTAGTGLGSTGNKVWNQNTAGILDAAESGDLFGYSLAAARFNADAFSDLAIGVPTEDLSGLANTGAVNVIYGAAAGLAAAGNQLRSQNSAGVPDIAETNDDFGLSLAVGDFNGDTFYDLVVAAPYEDLGGIQDMGAVNVMSGPFGSSGNQFWSQDANGILGAGEADDYFGYTNQ